MRRLEGIRAIALVIGVVAALLLVGGSVVALGWPTPIAQAAQTLGAFGGAWVLASAMGWDAAFGRRDARTVAFAAVAGLGLAFVGVGLLSLIVELSPAMRDHVLARSEALERLLRPTDPTWIPVVIVVVAILPGVLEERWFRGVVRDAMPSWTPTVRAVFVAVLFALAHLDPANLLPLTVVGIGFGLLAERAGGWWAPAVAHFVHNAHNGVVIPRVVHEESLAVPIACAAFVGGAAVFTAALWAMPRQTVCVDDAGTRVVP